MTMAIALLYREELKEYDFGPGHPFRGDRYEIFPRFLKERLSADNHYKFIRADWATDADLLLICRKDYIEFNKEYFKSANLGLDYHDSRFPQYHSSDNRPAGRPGKLEEAARLVVGQAKKACRLVHSGQFDKVVSVGGGLHHAKPAWGEGFCIYNDVAFAGKYLLEECGLERVLILDTDAHAGNGTAEYFYDDPRVLFVDIHQDPRTVYPGTGFIEQIGEKAGKGFTINIPMPVQAGDLSYRLAFAKIVLPVAAEFKPQVIIRNGGSDPHFADTLTDLGLYVSSFRMIGEAVRGMAKMCGGKVIDMIGSGYNKEILPYAWLALIAGLADFPVEVEEPVPIPKVTQEMPAYSQTEEIIKNLKHSLKEYWPCLAH
jgi:acetoin utilization protein AcuC